MEGLPCLELRVGSFAGTALAGVSGVAFLLRARQSPVAAGVGVEAAMPLRHGHGRYSALAGGVGDRVDPGLGEGVDDTDAANTATTSAVSTIRTSPVAGSGTYRGARIFVAGFP